jgi:hypothetical protein
MRFAHYDKEKERMSNKVRENQSGFSNGVLIGAYGSLKNR